MPKKKTSIGIEGLNALDIANVVEGADLQESNSEPKSSKAGNEKQPATQGKKMLSISLPALLHSRFMKAKEEGRYFGTLSSYIFEAFRERLDKDGFN